MVDTRDFRTAGDMTWKLEVTGPGTYLKRMMFPALLILPLLSMLLLSASNVGDLSTRIGLDRWEGGPKSLRSANKQKNQHRRLGVDIIVCPKCEGEFSTDKFFKHLAERHRNLFYCVECKNLINKRVSSHICDQQ